MGKVWEAAGESLIMSTHTRFAVMGALAVFIALAPHAVMARKASSLTDLNGARASSAESALQSRGLKYIDGRKGSYGESYSYWWDDDGNDCVVVEVSDGRVMTINDADKKDCHHSGDNAGAAVAAVAGLALLGALIAHKSDDHDDKVHFDNHDHEREYDRGYQDGLYHKSYHNYDDSKYYSRGYSKGVEQRNNRTQHHHGDGGYQRTATYLDLKDARAAGADSTLQQRGFRNVDGFKSGSTAYTIWNRPSSKQCLQMTVADGHVKDIRDIHSHPKCR